MILFYTRKYIVKKLLLSDNPMYHAFRISCFRHLEKPIKTKEYKIKHFVLICFYCFLSYFYRRRKQPILTSVRRIHGKRISDAELTIITNLTNLFPIKNDNYWLKIGKIGNYCQLKTACCLPYRNSSNSR